MSEICIGHLLFRENCYYSNIILIFKICLFFYLFILLKFSEKTFEYRIFKNCKNLFCLIFDKNLKIITLLLCDGRMQYLIPQ